MMLSITANAMTPAQRLVKAMALDRAILFGVRDASVGRDKPPPPSSPSEAKFRACVLAIDSGIFVDILAEALTTELTVADMQEALLFYESPVGRSYIGKNFAAIEKGGDAPGSKFEPPPAEQEAFNAFSRTEAGTKLSNSKAVQSPEVSGRLLGAWDQAVARCGASAVQK